ncbi:MAG: type 4a pilus biogenesis protein PilO [Candidatus Thiodiazotropha taylori]|nr:type 4a pilus biogenesis protein PilO [Candidatus Thiodiazotropha taylori]
MNLEDLNELDFSNVGIWPTPVKMVAVVLVAIAVMAAGYYLVIEAQLTQLDTVERKELDLRKEFETKQAKASNLDAYRLQLEEMKQSFGTMLRQLPDKTEVAELLVDVSQTGLASGLEFELFKPQEELPKEFYAELPIQIVVKGEYHEFGNFISGLAALPRIVTIHDVKIKRGDPKSGDTKLMLEATAKTYRYLDEEEGE